MLSIILAGLFAGSSSRAIDKIQESRIAETAREMVVLNNWVVPHYNGELRLQKPPLTYWLTASSYQLFGASEQAARIPSAIFAVLSAVLLFVWAKREFNIEVATNVVLILLSSFIGLRYFRSGEADAVLIFFITLASYAGYRLFETANDKRLVWLLMLGLGLGFLTKGPAAIGIPLLTILLYAFSLKKLPILKALANPVGVSIFLVTAFGWYLWILLAMPDVAQHFFSHQVDETFISGTHKKPIYWYLMHVFDFFSPWSLLIIPAGVWCYKHRPLPNLVRFSLIWLGVVFVLLTFTVNKQTQYALLFLPPITIFLAYYIEVATGKYYQFNRAVFWLLCIAVVVIIGLAVRKVGLPALTSPYAIMLLVLMPLPLVFKRLFKVPAPKFPVLIAATLAVFMYLYSEQYLTKEETKSDIKILMQSARTKGSLYQTLPGDGAVSFYAERPIKPLAEKQLQIMLTTDKELWLVGKHAPVVQGIKLDVETQVGDWTLWKLAKLP